MKNINEQREKLESIILEINRKIINKEDELRVLKDRLNAFKTILKRIK